METQESETIEAQMREELQVIAGAHRRDDEAGFADRDRVVNQYLGLASSIPGRTIIRELYASCAGLDGSQVDSSLHAIVESIGQEFSGRPNYQVGTHVLGVISSDTPREWAKDHYLREWAVRWAEWK